MRTGDAFESQVAIHPESTRCMRFPKLWLAGIVSGKTWKDVEFGFGSGESNMLRCLPTALRSGQGPIVPAQGLEQIDAQEKAEALWKVKPLKVWRLWKIWKLFESYWKCVLPLLQLEFWYGEFEPCANPFMLQALRSTNIHQQPPLLQSVWTSPVHPKQGNGCGMHLVRQPWKQHSTRTRPSALRKKWRTKQGNEGKSKK